MKYLYDDFMNLKVKSRSNLYRFGFTRCEEDKCWRLIVKTGVKAQEDYADSYSFVISIYDEDYNLIETKFKFHFYYINSLIAYRFKEFFENNATNKQLEIQHKFIDVVQDMINCGILEE